jgi:hypothetical protein
VQGGDVLVPAPDPAAGGGSGKKNKKHGKKGGR